jgi:hypothetical protein
VTSKKVILITSAICIIAISVIAVNRFYGYIFEDNVAQEKHDEITLDNDIEKSIKRNEADNRKDLISSNEFVSDYKDKITDIEPIAKSNDDDVISVDTVKEPRIMSSTRIEYQNYYTLDDKLEIEKEIEPPYYMIDLTRQQIEEFYPEFQLVAFSSEKVILRRIIEDHSDKYYIIKRYNTNIGVFHDYRNKGEDINADEYLRDTIDIPINDLVWEEQEKLNTGIIVYGEEELSQSLKKLWQLYRLNQSGKYILREYNGVMGIFYDYKQDEKYSSNLQQDKLNELLDGYLRKVIETPVSGLEEEFMIKLKEGITVNSEVELIRLLENYTS